MHSHSSFCIQTHHTWSFLQLCEVGFHRLAPKLLPSFGSYSIIGVHFVIQWRVHWSSSIIWHSSKPLFHQQGKWQSIYFTANYYLSIVNTAIPKHYNKFYENLEARSNMKLHGLKFEKELVSSHKSTIINQ